MTKDEMVAWLRAWAQRERKEALDYASEYIYQEHRGYARGIEEAANEIEERLT